MQCDICQRPATGWCESCQVYYCADHGGDSCYRCAGAFVAVESALKNDVETSIYTTDKASRPGGPGYLQCDNRPAMPTIHIDDDGPPECYECEGLANKICTQCQNLFCSDHAGTATICQNCVRSSRMGLYVFAVIFAVFAALLYMGWLLQ